MAPGLRLLHGLEVAGHDELAAGGLLHVLHGEALADLDQVHAGVLVDVEHALGNEDLKMNDMSKEMNQSHHFSDDHVHAVDARERQVALVHDLVLAALGRVLHGHDDLGVAGGHKVHGAAHALHHLALNENENGMEQNGKGTLNPHLYRYHPVREVSQPGHLHRPQDRDVDVAT